jgi:outer membrane lipopolysaccharide assembly protein LptE/RlpB
MKQLTLLTAMAWMLAACGASDSDEVEVRDEGETVGAEIASDYNRQMDRARNVEIQLDDHKRDLDAAIEQQTDPDR